jgi:hypothetical protein
MKKKICYKCKLSLYLSEFSKNKSSKDGYCKDCKNCHKEYCRNHYLNNKKYYSNKNTKYQEETKIWYKDFKNSLKCQRCPENHPATLDFHHLDKNKKDKSISSTINNGWSIKHIKEEISKCIVLCSNCHRKEHFIQE